jgi:peroxiredoxin Q/BCP
MRTAEWAVLALIKKGVTMLELGSEAPSFTLEDSDGQQVRLEDFRGKKVILWFYPKDDTPGWTKEACEFRDAKTDFEAAGAVIVGISPDGIESHQQFRAKYGLPLILLADPEHLAIAAYDVWRERQRDGVTSMGIERSTFLIDEEGVLTAEKRKVQVDGHVEEMLAQVR